MEESVSEASKTEFPACLLRDLLPIREHLVFEGQPIVGPVRQDCLRTPFRSLNHLPPLIDGPNANVLACFLALLTERRTVERDET